MSVTERQRHDLFKRFEETLGPEHAATMMELLPPVGWADVATKQDIDSLRVATKQDIDSLRIDVDSLRASTKLELEGLEHRLEARLGRSFMTWMLTGMGIQTAVVGLLVGLS